MARRESAEDREAIRAGRAHYYELVNSGVSPADAADIVNRRGRSATDSAGKTGDSGGGDLHETDEQKLARIASERRAVVIPEKWEELAWPDRRHLAASLTDEPVTTKEDVAKAIEAELALRQQPA